MLPPLIKVFGAESKDVLQWQLHLLRALDAQHKNTEAGELCRSLLPLQTAVLQALSAQNKHAEALCRSLLPLQTKLLGAENEETLSCQFELIGALYFQHKHAQVEELCRVLLPLLAKVLGAENEGTLVCHSYLIGALDAQDKDAEVEAECRGVLPLFIKVFGAESKDAVSTQNRLLGALIAQNKDAEVVELCRSLLPLQIKVLGAEAMDTLNTRSRLARTLRYQKKWAEAEAEYRQVLLLCERVLKPAERSPTVLSELVDFVRDLNSADKHAVAEELCRRLTALHVKLLGPENSSIHFVPAQHSGRHPEERGKIRGSRSRIPRAAASLCQGVWRCVAARPAGARLSRLHADRAEKI